MPQSKNLIYELNENEKGSLQQIIDKNIHDYKLGNYEQFSDDCKSARGLVSEKIKNWRDRVKAESYGLLKNLPVGTILPATPTRRGCHETDVMFANSVIGLITSMFGQIYTFEGKTTPRHIHDVYPVYGDELTQLGSSNNKLEWHVEDGFHAFRANWVALFCLKGDTGAITKIARARDLKFSDEQFRLLTAKNFDLRIDDSFGSDNHSTFVKSWILSGLREDPEIIFDPAYTVSEDQQTAAVLKMVDEAAYAAEIEFNLEAGDLLIFDNRKIVHGRTSYRPRMDGNDRWLKRALILEEDSWRSEFKNGEVPIHLFI